MDYLRSNEPTLGLGPLIWVASLLKKIEVCRKLDIYNTGLASDHFDVFYKLNLNMATKNVYLIFIELMRK